ncbi:MAG TPA: LysR family transcriptional regulator [Candidatus Hydrogenedentes bacterium]|nr:LysR family transcriptional regulator [Candidatus Hydrogenedentota bacterium]
MRVPKSKKPGEITPGFKLWLTASGSGVFGQGKWKLLEAIQREGSLRAAADALSISYRKAWGDLKQAEAALGIVFLERHRGGSGGGESCLTEDGQKWMREYARFHAEVVKKVQQAFKQWEKRMEK